MEGLTKSQGNLKFHASTKVIVSSGIHKEIQYTPARTLSISGLKSQIREQMSGPDIS